MFRILIIEDDISSARGLAKILLTYGFEVITAIDACQGLSQTFEKKPDLVILDLMLPAGGGLSVLKNIRSSSQIMNTPVVVISGMSDEAYKISIAKEKVDAFLTKPYDFQELNTIIQNILSNKKA